MFNFITTLFALFVIALVALALWLAFLNWLKTGHFGLSKPSTETVAEMPDAEQPPLTSENAGAFLTQLAGDNRMYWWLLPDGKVLATTLDTGTHTIDNQTWSPWSAKDAAWQVLYLCAIDWELAEITPAMGAYLMHAITPELREQLDNHLRESLGGDIHAERVQRALARIEQASRGKAE